MKLATLLALAALAPALFARDIVTANDEARFIAGLPLPKDSPLTPYTRDAEWKAHAAEVDAAWAKCEARSLSRTRLWAEQFVHADGMPCYYMFSGPDILYAHTIFPNAPVYVLCGTEPVGNVPDITSLPAGSTGPTLGAMRRSLSNVLRFSYFITKDMRVDLGSGQFGGVLPIFYFFLARTGCDITSVEPMSLRGAPGVRIVFRSGLGAHTLYYFNADLSNGGSGGAVMSFCRQQGTGAALLKAASYLLHEEGFSQCRNFLLAQRVIVQDDSGIPYRYLAESGAGLRFFGHYNGTTGGAFAKYEQPDLAAAYAHTTTADLDFSLSYQWNPKTANILIAAPAAAPKVAQAAPGKKRKR
jgi:hypothetical protein